MAYLTRALGCVVALFVLAAGAAAQEAKPPALPSGLTPAGVEGFVAPLTDAQARDLLIDRLKQDAASRPAQAGDGMATSMLRRLRDASQALRDRKDEIIAALADAPQTLGDAFDNLTDLQGWPAFGRGVLVLVATLLVGAGAEYGVARLLARGARPAAGEGRYGARLSAAGLHLAGGTLRLLTFAIVAYAASLVFLDRFDPLREMVVAFALIVVAWRAVALLADAALAPAAPARRLAFADDRAAAELRQHLVAFGGGAAVIVVMQGFLALIGVPDVLIQLFIVVAGAMVMVALVAAFIGDFLVEESTSRAHVAPVLLAGLLVVGFLAWAVDVLIGWSHAARDMALAAAILIVLPTVERLLRGVVAGLDPQASAAIPAARSSDRWMVISLRLVAALTVLSLVVDGLGANASAVFGQRLVDVGLSVGTTLLVATVIWQAITIAIDRKIGIRAVQDSTRDAEEAGGVVATRAETLLPLVRTFLWFALVAIVGMTALSNLGVDIGPLLAGAGVVGLAIGFGAQTLVRDIVAGIFFLIDDAIRVGEYIEFGNIRGEVEKISIRSLILRHHRGAIHVVPFGELKSITNYNRDWAIFKMEFGVPYDTDIDKVRKLVKNTGLDLLKDPEHGRKFLEPLKSQGVVAFGNSALNVRVKFKCKPREQFVLRRIVHQRIKQAFDDNGIAFAYPRVVVEGPGGALAAAAATAANNGAEAKPAA
ncbi:mechanosensitive ion channel family protein [Desertibaculum subflavum]|uniref:mechanosensitive ion channel family protein n=1 Tax=Desertibaculum subflavum TaxID=2268458 RepID=UPI000E669A77